MYSLPRMARQWIPIPNIFRAVSLLLLVAGPAFAGLDNSHHDITHSLPEKDTCLVCHSRRDTNYYRTMETELGTVGGQCVFLCHSGKGILPETPGIVPTPGPAVVPETYGAARVPDYSSVYFTRSHGRDPAKLKDAEGRNVPWPPSGLQWQGVAAGSVKLECSSCHNVHDNRYAPFLLAPLGAEVPKMNGICDLCHRERATNNLSGPPDGSHPVDFFVDNAASASRSGFGRIPRRIRIQQYGAEDGTGNEHVFDVPNPPPSALAVGGSSWDMGGHLFSGPEQSMTVWSGEGSRQQMGCYTCHSAHRPNANGENNLVVVTTVDNAATWNPICTGCHGAAVTMDGDRREWNVGMTPFGHPAGIKSSADNGVYTTTVGEFRFRISTPAHRNPQGGNRWGSNGILLCTTCHKVHFGQKDSMAVADLGQGIRSICKACHTGVGIPNLNDFSKGGATATGHNALNTHHVTMPPGVVTPPNTMTQTGESTAGYPNTLYINTPSWYDATTGIGDLSIGMDCADCHVFNGSAHGW
jgi:hypothetical protein